MSYFLSLRQRNVGGAVTDPRIFMGEGSTEPLQLTLVEPARLAALAAGKDLVFAAHGFNVSLEQGVRSLAQLDARLALGSNTLFLGVLWPGDYWLPVVNYPFEGEVAIDCGRRLATFCSAWLDRAQSISFVSHSLGVRVVLEAVQGLPRPVRLACLMAAAVNRDCLASEYAEADANAQSIALLCSRDDLVLKLAYPLGDAIAELLHDDHTPFQPALGYAGPPAPAPLPVAPPWQIPPEQAYGHGDYFPPGDPPGEPETEAKWWRSAGFLARALQARRQDWP